MEMYQSGELQEVLGLDGDADADAVEAPDTGAPLQIENRL